MLYVVLLILLLMIGFLINFIIKQNNKIRELQNTVSKLNHSFEELDEQAKLIVKTDLELNKAQEELDKRINGLDALQKISRMISTTFDENEIYNRLNSQLLTELGFEKYLIFIFDNSNKLQPYVEIGFSKQETKDILTKIEGSSYFLPSLKERQVFSSVNMTPEDSKNNLPDIFPIKHYVIAAIFSQKDLLGITFAGNRSDAFPVTEGDQELISIFANQIGQTIENARLFEQVYRSSQMLELKVQERTKQLASAFEEVQAISKHKSEFISAVSHELRTPLTSIKGYASILMLGKAGDIPDSVKERLEKINKHSDNLVKLINDLLDIARIEAGTTELKFVKTELAPILDNVHDLLTPQIKEKNIQFFTHLAPKTPQVSIDPNQVERILINLAGNAIKFTPENGTIRIDVQFDQEKIIISVSDTGIGIKKEDLPKLFNEFYRVDNEINQNVKGSGLGLTLAKKIVEAHKGKIWGTSKPHEGSTFYFTLPLEKR